MLFSSSVTLKKEASLESFQQQAIQRENCHSNEETELGKSTKRTQKKNNFIETKSETRLKDIHTNTALRGGETPWIEGRKDEDKRTWRWKEEPKLWVHLALSFSERLRMKAGISARHWTGLRAMAERGLWKENRPPIHWLIEGQASAHPWDELEVTQRGFTPMEDDLKDRSIFIFSFVSHVSDFS